MINIYTAITIGLVLVLAAYLIGTSAARYAHTQLRIENALYEADLLPVPPLVMAPISCEMSRKQRQAQIIMLTKSGEKWGVSF